VRGATTRGAARGAENCRGIARGAAARGAANRGAARGMEKRGEGAARGMARGIEGAARGMAGAARGIPPPWPMPRPWAETGDGAIAMRASEQTSTAAPRMPDRSMAELPRRPGE
jgi:hypothetical protein